MNREEAYKKATIVSRVYDDWEDSHNNQWGRWRSIPMFVMIAKRKTDCEYCDTKIEIGELRTVNPTVHMRCFGERLEISMQLYKDIEQKLIEHEENENE